MTSRARENFEVLSGQNFSYRNKFINGGMQINQRNAVGTWTTISNNGVPVYGGCDRWAGYMAGFTGGNCRIQREVTSAYVGVLGSSQVLTLVGATGGAGTMALIQRVEAVNSVSLDGKTVTFSGYIAHNHSADMDWSITLYKPSSKDSWVSGASAIAGSSTTVTVPPNTKTRYEHTVTLSAGDAANGLQIFIQSTGYSGTIDTYHTDIQIEEGAVATEFEQRPLGVEELLCYRYFQKTYDAGTSVGDAVSRGSFYVRFAASTSSGGVCFTWVFKITMRVFPTIVSYSTNTGTAGVMYQQTSGTDVSAAGINTSNNATTIRNIGGLVGTSETYTCQATADAEL